MTMVFFGFVVGVFLVMASVALFDGKTSKLQQELTRLEEDELLERLPRFSVVPPACNRQAVRGRGFVAPTRRRNVRVGGFINV